MLRLLSSPAFPARSNSVCQGFSPPHLGSSTGTTLYFPNGTFSLMHILTCLIKLLTILESLITQGIHYITVYLFIVETLLSQLTRLQIKQRSHNVLATFVFGSRNVLTTQLFFKNSCLVFHVRFLYRNAQLPMHIMIPRTFP